LCPLCKYNLEQYKENIIKLYNEGYPMDKIAALSHVKNQQTIGKYLKSWGIVLNRRKKYDLETIKEVLIQEYINGLSLEKLAIKYNIKCPETIRNKFISWGVKLKPKSYDGKVWTDSDIEFLRANYWEGDKDYIAKHLKCTWCAIMHKAERMHIPRNYKEFMLQSTIKRNNIDNPAKRPEVREKMSMRMKKYVHDNPSKMLNRRLRRNKKTSIEVDIERILIKHNIQYEYNTYLKTKSSFKFPDFKIGKLIIEADNSYHHKDEHREISRDRELRREGYELLHFHEKTITKNIQKVERCILKKLSQLGMLEKNQLMILKFR
jgi:very-short-patch-repair endonuclease